MNSCITIITCKITKRRNKIQHDNDKDGEKEKYSINPFFCPN